MKNTKWKFRRGLLPTLSLAQQCPGGCQPTGDNLHDVSMASGAAGASVVPQSGFVVAPVASGARRPSMLSGAISHMSEQQQNLTRLSDNTPGSSSDVLRPSTSSHGMNCGQVHPQQLAARRDAPSINLSIGAKRQRVGLQDQVIDRPAMLEQLQRDVTASSARGCKESHIGTWQSMHSEWFGPAVPFLPLTTERLSAVASLFKARGYRSFGNYLSAVKQAHVTAGFQWTQQLDLSGRQCSTSVGRGLGPPRQSAAVDLVRLQALDTDNDLVGDKFVNNGKHMLIIGSFFLMREIESSLALVCNAELDLELRIIRLKLSATKSDPGAVSETREWGCVCSEDQLIPCAFHSAVLQFDSLVAAFGPKAHWPADLPLFPLWDGGPYSKEQVVAVYEHWASETGEPLIDAMGRRRIGGHTARVSGARYLAGIGLEVFKLCVLARWASATVLRYVQLAPLKTITADVKRLLTGESLHRIVSDIKAELARGSRREIDANLQACMSRVESLSLQVNSLASGSPRFIQNALTKCIHGVSTCSLDDSVDTWRTHCGWLFGRSRHRLLRVIDSSVSWRSICICAGDIRNARRAICVDEGSSSENS
jgi:hypothetical protein